MPKQNLKVVKRTDIGSWIHALNVPISRDTKFEMLELMRLDLLDHLDNVTKNCADADKGYLEWSVKEIKKVAKRLAEISLLRANAVAKAVKAGRVEFGWQAEERGHEGESAPEISYQRCKNYWKRGLKLAEAEAVHKP